MLNNVKVCNSIMESESGVGDCVVCLEIKPSCFNAYELVRSFMVSAKNSLTLSIKSMDPDEYFDFSPLLRYASLMCNCLKTTSLTLQALYVFV